MSLSVRIYKRSNCALVLETVMGYPVSNPVISDRIVKCDAAAALSDVSWYEYNEQSHDRDMVE